MNDLLGIFSYVFGCMYTAARDTYNAYVQKSLVSGMMLLLLLLTRSNFLRILKFLISACRIPTISHQPPTYSFKQTRGPYASKSRASHLPITRPKQQQCLPTCGIKVSCDGVFEMMGVFIQVCGWMMADFDTIPTSFLDKTKSGWFSGTM